MYIYTHTTHYDNTVSISTDTNSIGCTNTSIKHIFIQFEHQHPKYLQKTSYWFKFRWFESDLWNCIYLWVVFRQLGEQEFTPRIVPCIYVTLCLGRYLFSSKSKCWGTSLTTCSQFGCIHSHQKQIQGVCTFFLNFGELVALYFKRDLKPNNAVPRKRLTCLDTSYNFKQTICN